MYINFLFSPVYFLGTQFLKTGSEMLCGKTMLEDNGQIYKIISSLEDTNKAYDQKELESLPSKAIKNSIDLLNKNRYI